MTAARTGGSSCAHRIVYSVLYEYEFEYNIIIVRIQLQYEFEYSNFIVFRDMYKYIDYRLIRVHTIDTTFSQL